MNSVMLSITEYQPLWRSQCDCQANTTSPGAADCCACMATPSAQEVACVAHYLVLHADSPSASRRESTTALGSVGRFLSFKSDKGEGEAGEGGSKQGSGSGSSWNLPWSKAKPSKSEEVDQIPVVDACKSFPAHDAKVCRGAGSIDAGKG